MNGLEPEVEQLLQKISTEMKKTLSSYIGQPLTLAVMDTLREDVMKTIEMARSRHELDVNDYTKWVSLRRDPQDRNKVWLTLHDPYNAPAWLRQVFEQMSQP